VYRVGGGRGATDDAAFNLSMAAAAEEKSAVRRGGCGEAAADNEGY